MTSGETNGTELTGKLLGGRYRVTAVIGRGGMGVVARATDELLGREVAVKVLRAYTDASAPELTDLRERMRREAQAAARIRHTGVVTVHDVTEQDGLPVIVMELVDGPSLDDVLTERGTLPPREAAAIGAKLMDALDAAHRAGVLHRDVKPANVLLERGGRVVLTDFGIAAVDTAGDEAMDRLTRSGEIIGSLDFLPPERAQGEEPGPASDIWALGMTLYAAVEGASPFRRTSVWSTMTAIVNEQLPEPRKAGTLTPVLLALMAKRPESRPTAEQARGMLERVAAGGTVKLVPANRADGGADPAVPAVPAAPAGPVAPAAGMPAAAAAAAAAPAPSHQPLPQAAPPAAPAPPVHPYPQPPYAGGHAIPAPPPAPALPSAPDEGGRARRRSRTVIAAATAAVVLAGGGITYALTGKGGGKGGHDQAYVAPPGVSGSASSGPGDIEGMTSASPSPALSPSPSGTPSARSSSSASASASPKTSPSSTVTKSCTGWSHKDPNPGTYSYVNGNFNVYKGPYAACSPQAPAKLNTKVWHHCYVTNAYGHKWIYVRLEGTNTAGWMSESNLSRQKGSDTPC
ncbi:MULTISPECIES: serine/threonine-protein kinase [Streptomyces]|uniref:non-specific serine/threonine protein kinase n=1 Tax=Streptomyces luteosporeus TaxID=173856 RepID=A0ABP6G781_9ACTN